ncbi:glycosyltransferase [Aminipila sp.]|uniref:glycosyltransferase n=1 Tax=Aminipila sp. TaxID=2060095 RepID=UPI001D4B65C8|nr:glycosyltransferase [Aminipila sp.]MBE6034887.1 glycosyltransferase [Clostridiales bacterium]
MKILQINSVYGVGSTGRIVQDIETKITEHEYTSFVCYGRGDKKRHDHLFRIGSSYDNKIHGIMTRIFDNHGLSSTKATKDLINLIHDINPDIIHLHNIHGYYVNIKVLFDFLRDFKKPIVWTLHDCWAFTGHCAYFDYVNCDKWIHGCCKCPQKSEYPSSLWLDRSKQNYLLKKKAFSDIDNLTIVTPSKWLSNLVRKSFLSQNKIKVINNGIDLTKFKMTTSEIKKNLGLQDKFVILGVASVWAERKGLKYFIELADKLDQNYKIVLIGIKTEQKKILNEKIITIPRTDSIEELAQYYSMADVFINPTMEDNFPTTNIEALACGTPVITYNTGGSPETINEHCGIVVEKGNVEELIHAIQRVKHGNVSSEAAAISSMDFDKNEKFEEYIQLYEELLNT